MSNRLLVSLLLLIVIPLVLLGWLSTFALRAEEDRSRETLQLLFLQRLTLPVESCQKVLDEIQLDLERSIGKSSDIPRTLGDLRRNDPRVDLTFWMDRNNQLVYPQLPDIVDSTRIDDNMAIREILGMRPMRMVAEEKDSVSKQKLSSWMPWYRHQGLQLVLWIPLDNGGTAGVLLNRPFWISLLIGRFPDSTLDAGVSSADFEVETPLTRYRIVDSQNRTVYQWGDNLATIDLENETWYQLASARLPGPLAAWRMDYESVQPLVVFNSSLLPMTLGLLGIGSLMVLLGLFVATTLQRQMRQAAEHVNFAGQVSHELRTPLTNIRLYAEMAQDEVLKLSSDSGTNSVVAVISRRLDVIQQETQRLSRMCTSILSLLKNPQISGTPQSVDVASTVMRAVDQFRPALENSGIAIDVDIQIDNGCVTIDSEALEMNLMNLLSNVERYAKTGKWVGISVWLAEHELRVRIQDRGPGVPRHKYEKIFRPFFRLDNSINAPTGTGIGLTIARQAARRAGGDLTCHPSHQGACFELRLPVS